MIFDLWIFILIGIFDSGLGGLTVVKEVFRQLPGYRILYFGDTARTPYGTKSEQVIKKYSQENIDFLIKKGARVIIIACNTASALAFDYVKVRFGRPIFEVVNPAVRAAVALTENKRVGVMATRSTIDSGVYAEKIARKNREISVVGQSCPLLVPLIEENWLNKKTTKMVVRKYVQPLINGNIDTLILGCTHYPLIRRVIQEKAGSEVKLIDPAAEAVRELKIYLEENPEVEEELEKSEDHDFFVSDLTPYFRDVAEKWLGREIELNMV